MLKLGCLDYTFSYVPFPQSMHRQAEMLFAGLSKLHVIKYHRYLERAIRIVSNLGFDGVQVMCNHPEQMPLSPVKLANLCTEVGLEITSIGGYWNIFANGCEHLKLSIDYAAGAGANIVCTHSGYAKNNKNNWEILEECLAQLCDYAAGYGVSIAVENSPLHLVNKTEDLVRITKSVRALRVNMDPANLNCSGCDSVEAVLSLKKKIIHTHAKDSLKNTLQFPVLGRGDVNFKDYLKALKKVGYRGYLVVEYEGSSGALSAVKNGKEFLEQQIKRV